jgi:hypothetical protein
MVNLSQQGSQPRGFSDLPILEKLIYFDPWNSDPGSWFPLIRYSRSDLNLTLNLSNIVLLQGCLST